MISVAVVIPLFPKLACSDWFSTDDFTPSTG